MKRMNTYINTKTQSKLALTFFTSFPLDFSSYETIFQLYYYYYYFIDLFVYLKLLLFFYLSVDLFQDFVFASL